MDAKRNQVYTAAYFKSDNTNLSTLLEPAADDIDSVIDIIKGYKKPAVFVGDGVFVYEKQIIDAGFEIAPANCCFQRASSVGLAAIDVINQNLDVKYDEFEIIYARKPQAEQEAERKDS
jgi:tRNA threonylcarbamoyladenosine biosynthesis protein TsaB